MKKVGGRVQSRVLSYFVGRKQVAVLRSRNLWSVSVSFSSDVTISVSINRALVTNLAVLRVALCLLMWPDLFRQWGCTIHGPFIEDIVMWATWMPIENRTCCCSTTWLATWLSVCTVHCVLSPTATLCSGMSRLDGSAWRENCESHIRMCYDFFWTDVDLIRQTPYILRSVVLQGPCYLMRYTGTHGEQQDARQISPRGTAWSAPLIDYYKGEDH